LPSPSGRFLKSRPGRGEILQPVRPAKQRFYQRLKHHEKSSPRFVPPDHRLGHFRPLSTGQSTTGRDDLSGTIKADVRINPSNEITRFIMTGGRVAHADETLDLTIGPTLFGTARVLFITQGVASLPLTDSGTGDVVPPTGTVANDGHRMISNEGLATTRYMIGGGTVSGGGAESRFESRQYGAFRGHLAHSDRAPAGRMVEADEDRPESPAECDADVSGSRESAGSGGDHLLGGRGWFVRGMWRRDFSRRRFHRLVGNRAGRDTRRFRGR